MADIELVIKIDKSTYYRFIDGFADEDDSVLIENLFKNAVPLPKGHGRLIDADELSARCESNTFNTDTYNDFISILREIDDAPTIVEAESEEKE